MNTELEKLKIRISLLESRSKENGNIIKKLWRKIRRIENKEKAIENASN